MTIIVHINVTSGPMLGYFIYCQTIAFAAKNAKYVYDSILSNLPFHYVVMTRISIVIADFWNLQFFRSVLPPFCLSENISTIHVIMMSFVGNLPSSPHDHCLHHHTVTCHITSSAIHSETDYNVHVKIPQ